MNALLNKFRFPEDNIWPGNKEKNIPPYLFSDEIKMVLKVALITRRPILISGSPGSGKTTLAQSIADFQNWSYLKYTFTSRSRLEDLTGEIDQLQRLHDAQIARASTKDKSMLDTWAYHEPGLFWWGFDPELAMRRGGTPDQVSAYKNRFRKPTKPKYLYEQHEGVVMLLDEIDKADPDLPNDLLEPLDQLSFQLPTLDDPITAKCQPLVLITTNGERELPPAFLRRCITLDLPDPEQPTLINIANQHFKASEDLFTSIAEKFIEIRKEAQDQQRREPGTSEYLDAVQACQELGITPQHDDWLNIANATLRKAGKADER